MSKDYYKDGDLYCDETKAFARAEPCYFCAAPPPSDPHHYPPRGRGITRDDNLIPACRLCHEAAVGVVVVDAMGRRIQPPTKQWQEKLVRRFRLAFMDRATSEQFEGYARARRAWLEKRGIPW